jgi:hypothetical protein
VAGVVLVNKNYSLDQHHSGDLLLRLRPIGLAFRAGRLSPSRGGELSHSVHCAYSPPLEGETASNASGGGSLWHFLCKAYPENSFVRFVHTLIDSAYSYREPIRFTNLLFKYAIKSDIAEPLK